MKIHFKHGFGCVICSLAFEYAMERLTKALVSLFCDAFSQLNVAFVVTPNENHVSANSP